MKLIDIRCATALFTIVLAFNANAGDDSKKEVVPMDQPVVVSRWSVSTGADVSSIKTSFRADPGLNDGSTAIYNGTGVLVYANGTVGPAAGPPGHAAFTGGNITTVGAVPGPPPPTTFATFNGFRSAFQSSDDTETAVGPYIRLGYDIVDFDSNTLHLGAYGQYTFTTAFDSANAAVTNVATTYLVTGFPGPGAAVNFQAGPGPAGIGPTQMFSNTFIASRVNIDMHTFTLGLNLTKDLGNRVHLVLSTRPTLNLFETGLSTVPAGFTTTNQGTRSDDSKLRFGWIGQLGVQIDLDSAKRWFVEASGNYHYVDSFTVATPLASGKIQASSWGADLGLGLRF